jgi:hypothetical protein
MQYEQEKHQCEQDIERLEKQLRIARENLERVETLEAKRRVGELGDKWWLALGWRFAYDNDNPRDIFLVASNPGRGAVGLLAEKLRETGASIGRYGDGKIVVEGPMGVLKKAILILGIVPEGDIVQSRICELEHRLLEYSDLAEVLPPPAPWPHTRSCSLYVDCNQGFDNPRDCDCDAQDRKKAWMETRGKKEGVTAS